MISVILGIIDVIVVYEVTGKRNIPLVSQIYWLSPLRLLWRDKKERIAA